MGLNLFQSSCSVDYKPEPVTSGNPDPKNFKILRTDEHKHACAVEIVYPDSKNYEGRKILVYRCALKAVRKQHVLDPHFCDVEKHLSPFARFEPTVAGWQAACAFAASL